MIPILETKFNRRSKISAWTVILFLSMGWVSPSLFSSEIFPLGILGAKGEAKDDCHWILIQKVSKGSPAEKAGLIAGDRLIGIADQIFSKHSAKVDAGGSGPQRVLGESLDEAASHQKEDLRKVSLKVLRETENQTEPKTVTLVCDLPYRPSIRSPEGIEQLIQKSRQQLLKSMKSGGFWDAPVGLTGDRVLTAWACVALMASGSEAESESVVKILRWLQGPKGRAWIPENPLEKGPDNLGNWALTATAVALSEAQIKNPTEEKKKVIQTICDALISRMDETGLFGHDVVTGYRGKGFNVINTLSHLAWAISEISGAKISADSWNLSLNQIRESVDPNGGIRYWTMKKTGTKDASLRTSSMALALCLRPDAPKLKNKFCNYLDRFNTRTREAHAVGSMGMLLAPAALWQHDKEAYQRFLKEWRWYLSLMQNHKGEIQYIGGKRNNGGDSYLGKNRIACVIALMIASPPNLRLRIFHRQ
ncbi:hypothetical protein CBD41_00425 [bacterium TMED181]|nr:hypothetical protein [Planctomycetota bacterium]OUW47726.1 MAG: hypothetical protein CBD41_00425 [bacterium TMED181]